MEVRVASFFRSTHLPRLDVPLPSAKVVEAELVRHLRGGHGVRQVLLVREAEEHALAQLVLVEHAVELVARGVDAVTVVGVHHEDEPLRVRIVMAPEGADLVLSTDVPDRERNVLVVDLIDHQSSVRFYLFFIGGRKRIYYIWHGAVEIYVDGREGAIRSGTRVNVIFMAPPIPPAPYRLNVEPDGRDRGHYLAEL